MTSCKGPQKLPSDWGRAPDGYKMHSYDEKTGSYVSKETRVNWEKGNEITTVVLRTYDKGSDLPLKIEPSVVK
jgi:ribosomal protein L21E